MKRIATKNKLTAAEYEEWLNSKTKGWFGAAELLRLHDEMQDARPIVVRLSQENPKTIDFLCEQAGRWHENPIRDFSNPWILCMTLHHMLEKKWVTREHVVQFCEVLELYLRNKKQTNKGAKHEAS